ncbi:hypothetical protein D516_0187 [Rhodobacter sp. AKP1]|nr:hypothetical protein D516_0187 [Rhodobacter sp. AKP1]
MPSAGSGPATVRARPGLTGKRVSFRQRQSAGGREGPCALASRTWMGSEDQGRRKLSERSSLPRRLSETGGTPTELSGTRHHAPV